MKIALNDDKYALVDSEDFELVTRFKWSFNNDGYARRNAYLGRVDNKAIRKNISMHRFIMGNPEGMQVDHINGNKLDNRRINLRVCTPQENSRNRLVKTKGLGGYTGITFSRNKWQARITLNYKRIWLGQFDTQAEALEVRRQAVIKYFGDFAPVLRED